MGCRLWVFISRENDLDIGVSRAYLGSGRAVPAFQKVYAYALGELIRQLSLRDVVLVVRLRAR
jgi:hypothetical protein